MSSRISQKKIGIFGGSFDPIHQGHLNIAKSAYEEFHLDEVWFIPAGHSPNKGKAGMISAMDRAKMVELAIAPYPYFRLSMIEIESSETSYTYLTMIRLSEMYPDTEFYFIMGADSLDYFEKWRHPEIICQKAILLVAVRDDLDTAEIRRKIGEIQQLFEAEIYPVKGGKTDISSTALRKNIQKIIAGSIQNELQCNSQNEFRAGSHADVEIMDMLPASVAEYIIKHGLYQTPKQDGRIN